MRGAWFWLSLLTLLCASGCAGSSKDRPKEGTEYAKVVWVGVEESSANSRQLTHRPVLIAICTKHGRRIVQRGDRALGHQVGDSVVTTYVEQATGGVTHGSYGWEDAQ